MVITLGQSVTLKLQVSTRTGATTDRTADPNTRIFANARLGQFTGKNRWTAKPDAAGKTLVFYGRYYHPSTRRPIVDQVVVSVRPVRVRPGRR